MGQFDRWRDQDVATSETGAVRDRAVPPFLAAGNQAVARAANAEPHMLVRLWGLGSAWDAATSAVGEVSQGLFGQELRGSVGVDGVNHPGDVIVVERMLGQVGYADWDVGSAIAK